MDCEEAQEVNTFFKPSYVLIAVDTNKSMFEAEGTPTPFKNSMKALYKLSDGLLLKSNRGGWSPFSIILYDKDEKANLVDFKDNMIGINKLLKEKSAMSEDNLKLNHMRNYDLDLAEFFQFCKKKFKEISNVFYKRTLIFITNDPDPVKGDLNKRFTSLNEAKNFEENEITFQLVVTNGAFKFDLFYTEVFAVLNQRTCEVICEDEEGLYEKLSSTIWFKHSIRKLLFYPFADDFSKCIKVVRKSYTKFQRLLNNQYVALDGKEVKKIKKHSENIDEPQASDKFVLASKQGKKVFHELIFDLGEKLEVEHTKFPIGYTLLYVCHRLSGIAEVIAEPRILEADATENLPYFFEFWPYCVNNDKVLICVANMKKGQMPKPVELIPKLIHGTKVFLVQQIPYANEFFEPERNSKMEEEIRLTSEQEKITDELIDQLTIDFSINLLDDVKTLKKQAYLKSKLLDEPRIEIEHREIFSSQEIDEKLEDLIDRYIESFPREQGKKRKK